MLLPSEKLQSAGVLGIMQSVLDDAERRQEELRQTREPTHEEKMMKAQISRSEELQRANSKINDYFFSATGASDTHKLLVEMARNIGDKLGMERGDGEGDYSFGTRLSDAVKNVPDIKLAEIERQLGLTKMGLGIDDIIQALKNPYDAHSRLVEKKLAEAEGGSTYSQIINGQQLVERLENVAKDRSVEEMKVDLAYRDAGEQEDPDELKADIEEKKAYEKVAQAGRFAEAVGEASRNGETGDPLSEDSLTTLLALAENAGGATAAYAESEGAKTPVATELEGEGGAVELLNPHEASEADIKAALDIDLEEQVEQGEKDAADDFDGDLIVQEGEEGIYRIIRRNADETGAREGTWNSSN